MANYKKIMNLKYQLRHGMKIFNYLRDYILYQIFMITLKIFKRHGKNTDNHSIRIHTRTHTHTHTHTYISLLIVPRYL